MLQNAKGQIFYGMHFYPGVARYEPSDQAPFTIFINENTLRSMDPTFAGRPVFVQHVDEVTQSLEELKKEADGWVVESFYNQADGKHWAKFIVVSEKAERAIKQGMKLSNCYIRKSMQNGGCWNGVNYDKEITGGEYEHLAIVPNPRYEESVIMTPDEFKKYNEDKLSELKRLSNNKGDDMGLKFFKRAKVENSLDIEETCVVLPKSGIETTIAQLISNADMMAYDGMAKGDHHVMVGDSKMTVNELVEKHKQMCDALEDLKKAHEGKEEAPPVEEKNAEDDAAMAEGDTPSSVENMEDEEAKKKALQLAEHEEEEIVAEKAKNEAAKVKADALRNANIHAHKEVARVEMSQDQVARGKARYGSN